MNIPKDDFVRILNGDLEEIQKYKEKLGLSGKKCACCGTIFVPNKRIDEKYCDKCRSIGYENTMDYQKKDFRREYKRQYALYMRNVISKEELDRRMENYKEGGGNGMMIYKIKSISHSGRKGSRGIERTDGRYPLRIGRIVNIDLKNLLEGTPLILSYVKDEKGNDYSGYCLRCSMIQSIHIVSENLFTIETNNSIYEFEKESEEN